MHTKDRLAAELRKLGEEEMAVRAEAGYYDDFLSPLPTPIIQLANELEDIATEGSIALRRKVINGEFDATLEESEAWAESPEGRATMAKLPRGE